MSNLYIDIHVIQSVPPSNLNRDDAGSPKEAYYGGVRRSRVSSQAWKRATRMYFANKIDTSLVGTRTKRIGGIFMNELMSRLAIDEEFAKTLTTRLMDPLGISGKKTDLESDYLLFLGRNQIINIVEAIKSSMSDMEAVNDASIEKVLETAISKVDVVANLKINHPIDVALFGRMVADRTDLNVDASVQVAHALSTHAVEIEFDYFTALDDEKTSAEQGAAMIGTVEFNSATLYRFATVAFHQLVNNLDGDFEAALSALKVFLEGFSLSMPTGHINSFAHDSLPALVTIASRSDQQPVNLVTAFENPISAINESGLTTPSIERFASELKNVSTNFGLIPSLLLSTYEASNFDAVAKIEVAKTLGEPVSFPNLLDTIIEHTQNTHGKVI